MDSKLAQRLLNVTRKLNNAANAIDNGPVYGMAEHLRALARETFEAAMAADNLADTADGWQKAAHALAADLKISYSPGP
jgi:hypothetical protein